MSSPVIQLVSFVFQDALKWLPSASGLTEEKKQSIGIELRSLVQHLANSKATEVSCCNQIKQELLPSCSYNKNHEILCASDCVELKFMPDVGRCIAATRDIQPGKPVFHQITHVAITGFWKYILNMLIL
jgi:hypothetical protein